MTLSRCDVVKRRALLGAIPLAPLLGWRAAEAATIRDGEEVVLPDPSRRLRWVAWAERGRMGRSVTLVLRKAARDGERLLWSGLWRDAYDPALRAIPDWRSGGVPLVALTLRYGAGAQEAVLLAQRGAEPPRRVAERLDTVIEWRQDAAGRTVLVAFGRDGSALRPGCFGWDGRALVAVPCGARPISEPSGR